MLRLHMQSSSLGSHMPDRCGQLELSWVCFSNFFMASVLSFALKPQIQMLSVKGHYRRGVATGGPYRSFLYLV